jgi:Holliday junction resolvasome RuvABC endonuclease subunit
VIIGLDLSLTATGVATPAGTFALDPQRRRGPERLDFIATQIRQVCDGARLVAVEGYSFGSRASHAHALGELGGVVRWLLWRCGIPYVDVPPASVKKYACGKGNSSKEEVLAAAIRRGGMLFEGSDNNRADSFWLRAMAMDYYGEPVVTVPAEHRKALATLRWPALRGAM